MSISDSIASSQMEQSSWRKSNTTWTLDLFGTMTGAGMLLFPVHADFGGLIPILLMLVLTYPIAFYCHRALACLRFSDSSPPGNITETVEEHFGRTGGVVVMLLYFFAICPPLRIYGVTITSTPTTFQENQLGLAPLNHGSVALFSLLLMAFVIWFGRDLMVRMVSYLIWSFIASLVLISLSLIPCQNSAITDRADPGSLSLISHNGIPITVWLGISITVFFSNFSPIVSSFVVSKHEEYEKDFGRDFTKRKCSQIISRVSMLMAAVVMLFALSCLFTLSPTSMVEAKTQNIPMSPYLANHFASMTGTRITFAIILGYAASVIIPVAILRSLFGHYLGTLEGLNGLILKFSYKGDKTRVSLGRLNTISMAFIMGSIQIVTYTNPDILDLIEAIGASIITSLLRLLPMHAIRRAPSLAKYRGHLDNVFVTIIGLLTILNVAYELF